MEACFWEVFFVVVFLYGEIKTNNILFISWDFEGYRSHKPNDILKGFWSKCLERLCLIP